ncbi:MAG: hypothetical protein Q9219_005116 [cf. Caloplaca sp. 3 TL-2023]
MADSLLPTRHPKASHGRGGAGNIGPTVNDAAKPSSLTTPTIKSSVYTTGRGGSGNMKRNDPKHPEVARSSQDVGPVVGGKGRRGSEGGVGHTGRGGVANVLRPSIDDMVLAAANENAVVNEGMRYDRQRQVAAAAREGSSQQQRQGDWWRDEMASGRVGSRN